MRLKLSWYALHRPVNTSTRDRLMPGPRARAGWLSALPVLPNADTSAATDEPAPEATPAATLGVVGGPRLARSILLAVLCSYAAVQVIDALTSPIPARGAMLAVDFTCLVLLFAMTVVVTSGAAEHWPLGRRLAVLLAQAFVTYLPMLVLLREWADLAGFFA